MEELIKRNSFFNEYDEEEEPKEFQDLEMPEEDEDDLYPPDGNEFYSTEEEF